MLVLKGLVVFIELFKFSFFSVTGWGIDLDYCDINILLISNVTGKKGQFLSEKATKVLALP